MGMSKVGNQNLTHRNSSANLFSLDQNIFRRKSRRAVIIEARTQCISRHEIVTVGGKYGGKMEKAKSGY
jgi:hypothetical protein